MMVPTGLELWKSDGTAPGTVLVKDIWRGSRGPGPVAFANAGDNLLFRAQDKNHIFWRSLTGVGRSACW